MPTSLGTKPQIQDLALLSTPKQVTVIPPNDCLLQTSRSQLLHNCLLYCKLYLHQNTRCEIDDLAMPPTTDEFWLPALKPVRSPWLARVGLHPIPCLYSERHVATVLLRLQAAAATSQDGLKSVLALHLLRM